MTTQPFTVRRVQTQDTPVLAALCLLHAKYERAPTSGSVTAAALDKALFGNPVRAVAWVLESKAGDCILGFATASPVFSTWRGEDFLHLDCLFIIEAARRQKGGSSLLAAVGRYALQAGFAWLEWQTPAWNAAAIRFYQRLGAVGVAKQRFSLPSKIAALP